jgi:hypothetical protein
MWRDNLCLFIFAFCLIFQAIGSGITEEDLTRMKFPQDEWMDLMISGVKVGYAHTYTDLVRKDGEGYIRIRSEMMMRIKRMGASLELSQTKESLLGLDLIPRHFISSVSEPGQVRKVEGWIEGNQAKLRLQLGDKTVEETVELPGDVIFEEALGYYALKKGLKVGDRYSLNLFSIELLKPIPVEVSVLRRDRVRFNGKEIPVYVLNYRLEMMGGIENTEWLDEDGVTYRMEMSGLMGMKMELVKTEMKEALGEVGEVDVIINTKLFPSGQPIHGHPGYLKARITLREGDIAEAFLSSPEQRIKPLNAGEAILEIKRLPMEESESPQIPINSPEVAQFLKPTLYVQSDDPAIRQKAREIIGDERNAWRAAKLICRWVYENIYDKSLKVGFGSAKNTLETLQGDCTEHTVLFSALARSIGIPTRICAGLVYHGDAFYYHFWPEVYVGRWVQMDPTLGGYQADATHIQLAGGKLESDTALEFGEGVLRTLNRLSIEVLEVR